MLNFPTFKQQSEEQKRNLEAEKRRVEAYEKERRFVVFYFYQVLRDKFQCMKTINYSFFFFCLFFIVNYSV